MTTDSYVIRARIIAEDATSSGASSAQKNMQRVENSARMASANIGSMFARAFAVMGGAALIGGAVRGMVSINAHAQMAKFSIASLFSAATGKPMVETFRIAKTELNTLREMAAVGAGELSDYTDGFGKLFMPLSQAGADLDRINRLIGSTIAVGALQGRGSEGMALAVFDVQQAMSTGLGQRTTPIINQVIAGIGVTTEAFNKLGKAARMETLEIAFKRYDGAITAMGATWDARMASFRDKLTMTARTLTEPLFERWSTSLSNANDWLTKNKDQIQDMAEVWGSRLVRVWDHLVERAATYATILAATAALQLAPGMGGAVSGAVGSVRGRVAGAVGAGSAFRGALADPFGMSRIMGNTAGSAGLASVVGGGLKGLFGSISRFLGPIALVVTGFMALKGGLDEFPGVLMFIKDQAQSVMTTFGRVGDSFAMLTDQGSALNLVGAGLGMVFGGLLWFFEKLVAVVGTFAVGLGVMLQIIGDGMKAIYLASTGDFAGASKISVMDRLTNASDQIGALWFGAGNNGVQGEMTGPNGEKLKPGEGMVNKAGDTIINGDINMNLKTETNADPARVLVAWEEGVDRLTKFRTQGRRVPSYAG